MAEAKKEKGDIEGIMGKGKGAEQATHMHNHVHHHQHVAGEHVHQKDSGGKSETVKKSMGEKMYDKGKGVSRPMAANEGY